MNIFTTAAQAEEYLEPVDVRNNEYVAYDSAGRLLRLTVEEKKVMLYSMIPISPGERVVIGPAEAAAAHTGELRDLLTGFLAACGEDPDWLAQVSLDVLVHRGLEKYKTE